MVRQLGAIDAQFLYMQQGDMLTHTMPIYIFDPSTAPGGQVRFKDIVRHVESRLDTSPVYRRKIYRLPFDLDHPYWVEDEHFDIEAHIQHARLPEPGDWRQFCIQAARYFSRPMDMNRPLWDMYVLEGLDRVPGVAPGSYAILYRIHHAAVDGASVTAAHMAMSDKDANGTPMVDVKIDRAELGKVPTSLEVLSRSTLANIKSPIQLMDTLRQHTPALMENARQAIADGEWSPTSKVPKTRFNAPLSPHRVFDAASFPLAEISAMRKVVKGATVNDAVLTICGGGMRRYLEHHGELPKESLVAITPVNLRSESAKADTPENNITLMNIPLCTDITDPIKQLAAIRKESASAKEAKSGLGARLKMDLSRYVPGVAMSRLGKLFTNPRLAPLQTNVVISNIPASPVQLYMNGARQTHSIGLAPLTNNMGLIIAVITYNGAMTFNVTSDRDIMPDIAFFRECLEEAYEDLRSAAAAAMAKSGDAPAKPRAAPRKRARSK